MTYKKIAIIITLLFVIGAGVGIVFWGQINKPSPDMPKGLIVSSNALYASDQKPGKTITISFVHLLKPGFVVVHENNSNNGPGQIIGVSKLLPDGETNNVEPITLSRSVIDGEIVHIMLHLDNGNGAFDPNQDQPVIDSIGQVPVAMEINISTYATSPGIVNP